MIFWELIPIGLVLFAAFSIVWFTLKTGISPMPSSARVIRKVCSLSTELSPESIYELGSGWGGLAMALAKKNSTSTVTGYELSTLPWLVSKVRNRLYGAENLTLIRKDFMAANLTDADLIICYLYPEAMTKLAHHLKTQLTGEIKVITHTFRLPGFQPKTTETLADLYRTPIYLYELKASEFYESSGCFSDLCK
ncbi:MAG: class I SAM-dependent methyltransferase [Myxococcota bacterium]|nr:class I SAM-dependent methyltransferase [Myxococcota bacterium]